MSKDTRTHIIAGLIAAALAVFASWNMQFIGFIN
jgi:hypothetical protein